MNTVKKLLALLLALTMLVGLMAACGNQGGSGDNTPGTDAEGPQYGGHLNVRMAASCTHLDPTLATGSWKLLFATCVYENPLTRDADNNIAPGVCDFELSEDELDLKLWVREGMTFSNGDPVDIYDVEASINRALSRHSSTKKYVKPNIGSITVENDGEKDILHIVFSKYSEKNMYYLAAYQTWCGVQPKEICEKYKSGYLVDTIEDAIGTGPYKFTEFQANIQVTVEKRDDYTPIESDRTGFAATKYGYMDSITFWYNGTDASACLAVLSGDYDVTEVVPSDYADMAESAGLVCTTMESDQRTWIIFNTRGTDNVCAKYPSLRKAIMAAIDYENFLEVITDGSQIFEGDNSGFAIDPLYATDAFTSQDYYGSAKQEVVDKYLEAAKAEGWTEQPVQLVFGSSRTDVPTLLADAMEDAGIKYKTVIKESNSYSKFIADPSNNWDFYFTWNDTAYTPSLIKDALMWNNYANDEKDALLAQMSSLNPTSEEYLQLWEQVATITAEGCYLGYMSAIDWWWWHPATLHINNDEGVGRFMYNAYWEDPQNHPRKAA